MTSWNKSRTLSAFKRDECGAVAITFALLAIMLFGFVGLAVDTVRGYNVVNRVGQGLDAAALAGAKLLDGGATDAEIKARVQAFFDQHVANMSIGGVAINAIDVAVDRRVSTVNVRARGTVDTTFGKVVGFAVMKIDKMSEVAYKLRKVEVALSLDITGSMAPSGKIEALKSASIDVIDTLFDEAANDDHVRIALIPWSSSVNAGALAGPASNNQSIDNCVIERLGPNAATDRAPFGADAVRASPGVAPNPYEFYACPVDRVVPLQKRTQRDALKSDVNAYAPVGGTAGHIGTAWGYYMLSPEWASLLPTDSQPRPYSPADTLKVLVLLTDGEFNMSYVTPGAYNATLQADQSYLMFQALCTQIRSKKILLYTVGFQLTNARAASELATCSDEAGQHFTAATNDELKTVFKTIANQIMQLRVAR